MKTCATMASQPLLIASTILWNEGSIVTIYGSCTLLLFTLGYRLQKRRCNNPIRIEYTICLHNPMILLHNWNWSYSMFTLLRTLSHWLEMAPC